MSKLTITPFKREDMNKIANLFNLIFKGSHYSYPLTAKIFNNKVLSNPDYKPEGSYVAASDNRIVGYILAGYGGKTIPPVGMDVNEIPGHICLIMVSPNYRKKGIGRELMKKAFGFLKDRKRKEVVIDPGQLSPFAFFPGIDKDWEESLDFFFRFGFEENEPPNITMLQNITNFNCNNFVTKKKIEVNKEGYLFIDYNTKYREDLLSRVSGSWKVDLKSKIDKMKYPFIETAFMSLGIKDIYNPNEVTIVVKESEVLGFCVMCKPEQSDTSYLGPIWISNRHREKGLGSILIQEVLRKEKIRGTKIIDLWTTGGNHYNSNVFYPRNGFELKIEWKRLKMIIS